MTFGDILKEIRMKKARAMLKSSSATVESIAESVGYQNVEHFNRTFKNCIISHRYSIETNLDPNSSLTKFKNVILKQIA